MMTMQANETLTPVYERNQPLRSYQTNSPRAKARLAVLALLADGHLDAVEISGLMQRNVFAAIGLSPDDFFSVMYDFCTDVVHGGHLLSGQTLEKVFGEIRGKEDRQEMIRLIFDVIRSDDRLSPSEGHLFWRAVEAWKLNIEDLYAVACPPLVDDRTRPSHYYG